MEKTPKEIFWDRMLEIAGHGTAIVGVRAGGLLDKAEEAAFVAIYTELSGIVGINDCFLDFYLSTLEKIVKNIRQTDHRAEPRDFLALLHMEAFHRFRAANLLLAKGHYTEAIDLCRGLWEMVLTVTAVARGMIAIPELFGGVRAGEQPIDKQEARRILRTVQAAANKIQNQLIHEAPGLSEDTKDGIRGMVQLMHAAVHKSTLSLVYNIRTWYDGDEPISILPQFDMRFAQVCENLLLFKARCLTRSFRFFDFLFHARDELRSWQDTFAKLDGLLEELVSKNPSPTARAIEEFVRVNLSFDQP